MFSRNRRIFGISVVALGIMAASGCATRKYVRQQTQSLQPAIQEASNASKENAERIDSVDKRAQQGITAAGAAAGAAAEKAVQAQLDAIIAEVTAQTADRKAEAAGQEVQKADNRIETLETRIANINDNYTVSELQTVTFKLNSAALSDQAKNVLDSIAAGLGGDRIGYMLELQGFTDNTGSEQYNIDLSKRRTESVERYLVSKNVPQFRISVVALGEESPVADNKTTAGRDRNRRVEVKVLTAPAFRQAN